MDNSNKINVKRRGVRLRTALDIQRALSRCYNGVLQGTLDPAIGARLAYIATVMLKCVELTGIEARLTSIETALSHQKRQS